MTTFETQLKRMSSNGSKAATCVRCKGEIPPFAGRPVALISGQYAHHPGQCKDQAERVARVRELAGADKMTTLRRLADGQPVLPGFAWECRRVEPGSCEPEICGVTGLEATSLAEHMKHWHGATQLHPTVPPIRLRKGVPAGKRQLPAVLAFKRIEWTADGVEHRGQFWANGAAANEVIVIEDRRADGLPNRLVTLYLGGDGQLRANWSDAKRSRRAAKRAA